MSHAFCFHSATHLRVLQGPCENFRQWNQRSQGAIPTPFFRAVDVVNMDLQRSISFPSVPIMYLQWGLHPWKPHPLTLIWIIKGVCTGGKSEPGKEPQMPQFSRMDFRCKLSARISSNNLAIVSPGAMVMAPSGWTSKMLWDPSKPTPQLVSKDQCGADLVPAQSPSTKHFTYQELGLRPPVPSSYPDGTLGFIGASSSPITTST